MARPVLACVRRVEGLLVAAALCLGCASDEGARAEPREPAPQPAEAPGVRRDAPDGDAPSRGRSERGLASYYADSLAGNKTASGERYNPKEMTAAHRTLPFGTLVEVARKDGRAVRVRINDRGPFGSKKRVIDLSRRAAEDLGMMREGVVPVTITVLK